MRRYFGAQFLAAIAGQAVLLWKEEWSYEYLAVFVAGELLVFATMLPLAGSSLRFHPIRSLAMAAGAVCSCWLAYLSKPAGFYGWLTTIDGGILVFFAVPTGLGAAHMIGQARKLALSLMALWMALGAFRLGFTLHLGAAEWDSLNEWLPTAVVAIGCLWLARIDRMEAA